MRTSISSFVAVSIVFGVTMAIGVPMATKQLHEATVQQCLMHDWPSDKAEAHLKFCAEYMRENG
jgi:hypothetical protein